MDIKKYIIERPRLKKTIYNLLVNPIKARPRWYIKIINYFCFFRERKGYVYPSSRLDLVPFNKFKLGKGSVIESWCVLNNQNGNIIIGASSRVGLRNTIMGPCIIGDDCQLAQNIVIVGFEHVIDDPDRMSTEQGEEKKIVTIDNSTIIGANSVLLNGTHIGKHCLIGAGSIVTKDIPDYSIAVGNPAKIIKRYNFKTKRWESEQKN
ncbi:MAG: acyltransferase [Bacteroidaceae bacterium]